MHVMLLLPTPDLLPQSPWTSIWEAALVSFLGDSDGFSSSRISYRCPNSFYMMGKETKRLGQGHPVY